MSGKGSGDPIRIDSILTATRCIRLRDYAASIGGWRPLLNWVVKQVELIGSPHERCSSTPAFLDKITRFEDLSEAIAKLPKPWVFTNGVFDVLHRGHVLYLAQARALGAA